MVEKKDDQGDEREVSTGERLYYEKVDEVKKKRLAEDARREAEAIRNQGTMPQGKRAKQVAEEKPKAPPRQETVKESVPPAIKEKAKSSRKPREADIPTDVVKDTNTPMSSAPPPRPSMRPTFNAQRNLIFVAVATVLGSAFYQFRSSQPDEPKSAPVIDNAPDPEPVVDPEFQSRAEAMQAVLELRDKFCETTVNSHGRLVCSRIANFEVITSDIGERTYLKRAPRVAEWLLSLEPEVEKLKRQLSVLEENGDKLSPGVINTYRFYIDEYLDAFKQEAFKDLEAAADNSQDFRPQAGEVFRSRADLKVFTSKLQEFRTTLKELQARLEAIKSDDIEGCTGDPELEASLDEGIKKACETPLVAMCELVNLEPGGNNTDVLVLSTFLADNGYLEPEDVGTRFTKKVKEALGRFQVENKILSNRSDGKGHYGMQTKRDLECFPGKKS